MTAQDDASLQDGVLAWASKHIPRVLPQSLDAPIRSHVPWLIANGASSSAKEWFNRLKQAPEAAGVEAISRYVLDAKGLLVRPGDDPPDLECTGQPGPFHVECTAIKTDTATRRTKLAELPQGASQQFRPLTDAIAAKLEEKARIRFEPSQPQLMIVGSYHGMATQTLGDAMFVELFLDRIREKMHRTSWQRVSAILVLSLGAVGNRCYGMLLPNAARPFSRESIPNVNFQALGDASFEGTALDHPGMGVFA